MSSALDCSWKARTPFSLPTKAKTHRVREVLLHFPASSGPPIILGGQLAEGYANDANRSFSYLIKTYPVADSFTVVGLPPGLDFNQSTGRISGVPLQGGSYQITVTADNAYGSDQGNADLRFASLIGFSHSATFDFSGYDGNQTLLDFPIYLTLDSSIDNFSLKSFSSKEFHDLRFFDNQGRELNYEIDLIQPDSNQLTVWVQVKEMNASNTISAHWGNRTWLIRFRFTRWTVHDLVE